VLSASWEVLARSSTRRFLASCIYFPFAHQRARGLLFASLALGGLLVRLRPYIIAYILNTLFCAFAMSNTKDELRPSSRTDSEKTAAPSVQTTVADEKKGAVDTVAPAAGVAVDAAQPITGEKTSRPNSTAEPTADDEDTFEYPTKWRLAAITVALCLSVFCMALVRCMSLYSPVPRPWYTVDRQRLHLLNHTSTC
jgi:hypothetical protein